MPYDTRADTEVRQNDTNAWNPAPFRPGLIPPPPCGPAIPLESWDELSLIPGSLWKIGFMGRPGLARK